MEHYIAQHEKLIKILGVIKQNNRYAARIVKSPFETQQQFEARKAHREAVKQRLERYYYTQLFKHTSQVYNKINQTQCKSSAQASICL